MRYLSEEMRFLSRSKAKQSNINGRPLDCRVACAHRNDDARFTLKQHFALTETRQLDNNVPTSSLLLHNIVAALCMLGGSRPSRRKPRSKT